MSRPTGRRMSNSCRGFIIRSETANWEVAVGCELFAARQSLAATAARAPGNGKAPLILVLAISQVAAKCHEGVSRAEPPTSLFSIVAASNIYPISFSLLFSQIFAGFVVVFAATLYSAQGVPSLFLPTPSKNRSDPHIRACRNPSIHPVKNRFTTFSILSFISTPAAPSASIVPICPSYNGAHRHQLLTPRVWRAYSGSPVRPQTMASLRTGFHAHHGLQAAGLSLRAWRDAHVDVCCYCDGAHYLLHHCPWGP
jgi:hypothetical protein